MLMLRSAPPFPRFCSQYTDFFRTLRMPSKVRADRDAKDAHRVPKFGSQRKAPAVAPLQQGYWDGLAGRSEIEDPASGPTPGLPPLVDCELPPCKTRICGRNCASAKPNTGTWLLNLSGSNQIEFVDQMLHVCRDV